MSSHEGFASDFLEENYCKVAGNKADKDKTQTEETKFQDVSKKSRPYVRGSTN